MNEKIKKFFDILKLALFPDGIKCIVCDGEIKTKNDYCVCQNCTLPINSGDFCLKCGTPMDNMAKYCQRCKNTEWVFTQARRSLVYDDVAKKLIRDFKFGGKKYLSRPLSAIMYDTFKQTDWQIDIVVAVPLSKERLRAREYNQAQLLAQAVSKQAQLLFDNDILLKIKDVPFQARLSIDERRENIKGCYEVCKEKKPDLKNKNVLLIDDVLTTGATADECAKMLKKAGAAQIYVLTAAGPKPSLPLY